MSPERYAEADRKGAVTEEEFNQGWHFCANMDDLLLGPGMDLSNCTVDCGWPRSLIELCDLAEEIDEATLVEW